MNTIIITLSRIETFILTWAVHLVGVLGVALALVILGWKAIERILSWAHVYKHFREWYIDRCIAQAKAEHEARIQKEYEAQRAARARGETPPSDAIFDDDEADD